MKEPMTPKERIDRAIRLEVPDRVPIFPLVILFPARHVKVPMAEFMADKEVNHWASRKTFQDFGGWDAVFPLGGFDYMGVGALMGMKVKFPGKDLPPDTPYQTVEEPILTPEDYDTLADKGWAHLAPKILCRIRPQDFPPGPAGIEKAGEALQQVGAGYVRDVDLWKREGVESMCGGVILTPFNKLSLMRSMEECVVDLYRRPQQVLAALEALTEGFIEEGKRMVEATGVRRLLVADHRSPGNMLSLKFFEKFSLPFLKRVVEAFAQEEIISILHCDSDWTKNLPYLRELPQKKCVLMLDGYTDILRAKEVLGDHMCIMGDVHASLLSLGAPEEVEEYVRKLIDTAGKDGGFILSTGCELPPNCKEENFRAMLDTAKSYGVYR